MATLPSHSPRGVVKTALVTVPIVLLLGFASGWLSNSGFGNHWYDPLNKPSFQPPAIAFPIVWTTLYILMGISLAIVLNQPPSGERSRGLALFGLQLVLNLIWSPIFFGAGAIDWGFVIILAMDAVVTATLISFFKLRPLAGALLLPYLAWLCLATVLNHETGRLNPGADRAPLGLTGA